MKYIIAVIFLLIWLYLLWVTERAKLNFWHYIVGAMGLFLFMMIWVRPVMTEPLARAVAAICRTDR